MDALYKGNVSCKLGKRTTFAQTVGKSLYIPRYFELKVNFAVPFSLLCQARSEEKETKVVIFKFVSYNIWF